MSLKDIISSPLEAGPSILDAHHLPPHLAPALEYASSRLARKGIHITLIVVRRDYQLPSVVPPLSSPSLAEPPTPSSPRYAFSVLKQLARKGSMNKSHGLKIHGQGANVCPLTPLSAMSSPRGRWPATPTTPMSLPLMTNSCTTASTITDAADPLPANRCAFRLVYPSGLSEKEERVLRHALQRAEVKFDIGSEWLSPAMSPEASGLSDHLIHRSMVQNEVLFSAEGMTILTLDRLYSLKAALSAYTKTRSPLRLEDAVDELRRLILATNGRKVSKSDLFRSYDWLSLSHRAVVDLDRMYKRAYGGPEEIGAISGMSVANTQASPMRPQIDISKTSDDTATSDESQDEGIIGIALLHPVSTSPKQLKVPILKLQTSFEAPKELDLSEDEDDDLTPRPQDHAPIKIQQTFNAFSIDELLSADILSPARSPGGFGPRTPNGYDDISPVTRGEWGFLMVDDAFSGAKTAAVETWDANRAGLQ